MFNCWKCGETQPSQWHVSHPANFSPPHHSPSTLSYHLCRITLYRDQSTAGDTITDTRVRTKNDTAASSHLPPGRRGKTSSQPSTRRNATPGRSVPIQRRGSTRCATQLKPETYFPSSRSTLRESTSWSPSLWPTDTSVHNMFKLNPSFNGDLDL